MAFEYPCGWQTTADDGGDEYFLANATRSGFGPGGDAYVDVQVRCHYQPVERGFLAEQSGSGNYEEVAYEYDGDSRTAIVSAKSTAMYGTTAHATVPFDGSLVHVEFVSTMHVGSCAVEPRPDYDVVKAMVATLAPNERTDFSTA